MRGITLGVEPATFADLLQPLAHDAGRQPANADAPRAVDSPKQRAADQTAGRQPRLEHAHRTGVRDIARGELVLEVPAHRDDDDLGEEMASFEELVQA